MIMIFDNHYHNDYGNDYDNHYVNVKHLLTILYILDFYDKLIFL